MFTSLIDAKILSQWEAPDENLVLFDSRIAAMREKLGLSMVRTPTYESTPPFAHTGEILSWGRTKLEFLAFWIRFYSFSLGHSWSFFGQKVSSLRNRSGYCTGNGSSIQY